MMVLPEAKDIQALEIDESTEVFLCTFLAIVRKYPQNRILLFAWIFCAYELDVSTRLLGNKLQCTSRNIRYILAEVRSSRRGEGKTGRPLNEPEDTPETADDEGFTLGITRFAGLWLVVPWILLSNLLPLCHWLECTSVVGSPQQFVLTLLALAMCGLMRIWALRDIDDVGFALFTGRWTPLRPCQMYTWMGRIRQGMVDLFYQATKIEEWRLVRHHPAILSNDEHVVGHQGGPEMPKGRVPKNGRNMRAHHLFMTFHLSARRFVGLCVTNTKRKLCHVAAPILGEMEHARQQVRDSAADTSPIFEILDCGSYSQDAYRDLLKMHFEERVECLARIRRTAKNVRQWDRGLTWGEYDLEPYVRGSEWDLPAEQQDRLCLAHTTTTITGVETPLPTLLIIDRDKIDDPDPKAKYVAVFASLVDLPDWIQADIYTWRQDHELAYRDSIHALGLDAKPKGYEKENPDLPLDHPVQSCRLTTHRIHFSSWVKALGYNRVRDLLDHLPEPAPSWTVLTAIRKLICRTAVLRVKGDCFWVIFDPFPDDHVLTPYCAWVNASDFIIPWLNDLKLRITVADKPAGATYSNANQVRKLLFDP
jgi:hypothetical protein